eukprot:6176535-Pleurochrysis_carterae.AAC.1
MCILLSQCQLIRGASAWSWIWSSIEKRCESKGRARSELRATAIMMTALACSCLLWKSDREEGPDPQ